MFININKSIKESMRVAFYAAVVSVCNLIAMPKANGLIQNTPQLYEEPASYFAQLDIRGDAAPKPKGGAKKDGPAKKPQSPKEEKKVAKPPPKKEEEKKMGPPPKKEEEKKKEQPTKGKPNAPKVGPNAGAIRTATRENDKVQEHADQESKEAKEKA